MDENSKHLALQTYYKDKHEDELDMTVFIDQVLSKLGLTSYVGLNSSDISV